MLHSCSATQISYKGTKILHLSYLVFKIWSKRDRRQMCWLLQKAFTLIVCKPRHV